MITAYPSTLVLGHVAKTLWKKYFIWLFEGKVNICYFRICQITTWKLLVARWQMLPFKAISYAYLFRDTLGSLVIVWIICSQFWNLFVYSKEHNVWVSNGALDEVNQDKALDAYAILTYIFCLNPWSKKCLY